MSECGTEVVRNEMHLKDWNVFGMFRVGAAVRCQDTFK